MISVKILGWLAKQSKLKSIDLPYVCNTDELLSLLTGQYPKFRDDLKRMALNNVYYVIFIDNKPYNIMNLLKNAVPLRDGVFVEFVPFYKFNAGYYQGVTFSDVFTPFDSVLFIPFLSHLFTYLDSHPIRAEDNEPYREVFKRRQTEYENFKKSVFGEKSKGDFLSEANTIQYGSSIPLIYGKIICQGKTIINNVVTSIVPKISTGTLNTVQGKLLNSDNTYINTNDNNVGGQVSAERIQQLHNARIQNLDFSLADKARERWVSFEEKFNNNDSYHLNSIVQLRDSEGSYIIPDTPDLSFKSYYFVRPSKGKDEGGAPFFFYLYNRLVGEAEEAFKGLREQVLLNQDKFLIIFKDENRYTRYLQAVTQLHQITQIIRERATGVYNLAQDASHGGNHGKITDIHQDIFRVFGYDEVLQRKNDVDVIKWKSTQGDKLTSLTLLSQRELTQGIYKLGYRGRMFKLIEQIKQMQI